jgi:hypothetical protein
LSEYDIQAGFWDKSFQLILNPRLSDIQVAGEKCRKKWRLTGKQIISSLLLTKDDG